jgi:hypothetical protein
VGAAADVEEDEHQIVTRYRKGDLYLFRVTAPKSDGVVTTEPLVALVPQSPDAKASPGRQ